jgi:hypothetical protein
MTAVVVMPTAVRTEFLALSLEALDRAGCPYPVQIYSDHVTAAKLDEVEYVRDTYYPTADILYAAPHTPAPSGCWNILHAIKGGYEGGFERVFLVEEDVIVRRNYFEWHDNRMMTGEYVATCGRKDRRFYPLYPDVYTNPGSCLRRDLLDRLVPHINDRYFLGLGAYLDEQFGRWDEMSQLDDGLIRRVIREMGGKVKYPSEPTCAHQGFHYYNRLHPFINEGTIQERVHNLRVMLKKVSPTNPYSLDFEL